MLFGPVLVVKAPLLLSMHGLHGRGTGRRVRRAGRVAGRARTSQFQAGLADETSAVRPQCGPHLNTAKQFSALPEARSARSSTSCTRPSGRALGSCGAGFCRARRPASIRADFL